jgi:hypothetical protein
MTDDLRSYDLAAYERARRLGTIVEGDAPATPRECIDALTRATSGVTKSERRWALDCFADGAPVWLWTERTGRVNVDSIEMWDALHAGGVAAIKGDA